MEVGSLLYRKLWSIVDGRVRAYVKCFSSTLNAFTAVASIQRGHPTRTTFSFLDNSSGKTLA